MWDSLTVAETAGLVGLSLAFVASIAMTVRVLVG